MSGGHHFRALNRNRRNLCLDLRRDRGLDVAWRLIDRAQVMVSSYIMEALGLGYAEVRASSLPRVRAHRRLGCHRRARPTARQ